MIERTATFDEHEEPTIAFYTTSHSPTPGCARSFANLARGHWGGSESRNHWVRDACMREDKTRSKQYNLNCNLSALREACAAALVDMDFPGYAIGGVSVGEGHELLCRVTEHAAPLLPEHKPRYLMGVGLPEDVIAAIGLGIDLFDCVIPTRYARSASLFTRRGRIRLTQRRYRNDRYPIDTSCDCEACAGGFSRAYLHHLFAANEILSAILASIHNVRFYQRLVAGAREAILADRFEAWRAEWRAAYAS